MVYFLYIYNILLLVSKCNTNMYYIYFSGVYFTYWNTLNLLSHFINPSGQISLFLTSLTFYIQPKLEPAPTPTTEAPGYQWPSPYQVCHFQASSLKAKHGEGLLSWHSQDHKGRLQKHRKQSNLSNKIINVSFALWIWLLDFPAKSYSVVCEAKQSRLFWERMSCFLLFRFNFFFFFFKHFSVITIMIVAALQHISSVLVAFVNIRIRGKT